MSPTATDRRPLVQRLRDWRDEPRLVAFLQTPAGRLVHSLVDLGARDRALTLAGQAFIALVPLVIVLATWLSAEDSRAVGDWVVRHYGLEGSTAAAVDQLFATPPDTTSGISLLGLAIVLVSVNSFARTLQRTYEVAWDLPPRAPRRTPNRLVSLLLLSVLFVAVGWVVGVVRHLPLSTVLVVPAQLAVAVPAWLLVADLLLSRRVAWRLLVPGAALSAVAHVVATWAGAVWVPHLIERNAERYGVVGVAVALISWLVALAFLVVASATTGAWAGHLLAARDERRRRASGVPVDGQRAPGRPRLRSAPGDDPR